MSDERLFYLVVVIGLVVAAYNLGKDAGSRAGDRKGFREGWKLARGEYISSYDPAHPDYIYRKRGIDRLPFAIQIIVGPVLVIAALALPILPFIVLDYFRHRG